MSRKYLIAGLYFIILLLLAANLFVIYGRTVLDRHYSLAFWFYFDLRANFPFFFSTALLVANIFLLYKITRLPSTKEQLSFWKTLLITFTLFCIDEAFYIHQHFKMSTFGTIASYDIRSWTHYIWVIPYFLIFGILFIMLFIKARVISSGIRQKLLLSAFVFLTGAVGMEFAGTFYSVIQPKFDVYLLSIKTAEGVLQLVGSVMFLDVFYQQAYDSSLARE